MDMIMGAKIGYGCAVAAAKLSIVHPSGIAFQNEADQKSFLQKRGDNHLLHVVCTSHNATRFGIPEIDV